MSTSQIALRRRSTFRWIDPEALRDVGPVLIGLAPFAMVLGLAMSDAAISTATGTIGSFLLWAGSAQLAAIGLMKSGAGIVSILAAVVAINARLLIYGAALEPMFRSQPAWFKWLAPHVIVDQNYALATSRPELREPNRFRRYWLTVAAAIGAVWLTTIAATMSFGALLPPKSPLTFASITVLVGLLVPRFHERHARRAALAAAVAAGAGVMLPHGIGLVVGILVGAFVPSLIDGRTK
jgi:predicted branched-subunit amino acid permease